MSPTVAHKTSLWFSRWSSNFMSKSWCYFLRWVRFKAGEITWSENGTIPFQSFQLTDRVPRKEFWCNWAMGTKTYIGRRNPHQECCHMSSVRYVTCQHEGCTVYVHKFCQHDWLKEHCYAVPANLPISCRDHTESYGLDSQKDSLIGHRMDVYQVQVSLDYMCNPFVAEWTY